MTETSIQVDSTAAPTDTTTATSGAVPFDRGDISNDFPITTIVIATRTYRVAVAADPDLRARGLMGVTDLGDLDGMLFEFPEASVVSFWMQDTPISLDIAFFDDEGLLVSDETMNPCSADPCPRYESPGPVRYAVEVPAGLFSDLAPGARLAIS